MARRKPPAPVTRTVWPGCDQQPDGNHRVVPAGLNVLCTACGERIPREDYKIVPVAPPAPPAPAPRASWRYRAMTMTQPEWPEDPDEVTVLVALMEGPQTKQDLMRALGIAEGPDLQNSSRKPRAIIERLRLAGFPVVSRSRAGGGGYHLTDDPDEIEEFYQREYEGRIRAMLRVRNQMRKVVRRRRAEIGEGLLQQERLLP